MITENFKVEREWRGRKSKKVFFYFFFHSLFKINRHIYSRGKKIFFFLEEKERKAKRLTFLQLGSLFHFLSFLPNRRQKIKCVVMMKGLSEMKKKGETDLIDKIYIEMKRIFFYIK